MDRTSTWQSDSHESPVSPVSAASKVPFLRSDPEKQAAFSEDIEKTAGLPRDGDNLRKGTQDRNDSLISWYSKLGGASRRVPEFETQCRTLESCPEGYPRLAAFLSSDYNFMIYREFGYLHARLLLAAQQELVALEEELDDVDKIHAEEGQEVRLKCWEVDKNESEEGGGEYRTRPRIMSDIQKKLLEYDELLIKTRELESFQRPANRDYRSVRRWFNNMKPLVQNEMEYIKCKEDFVTLRHGRECAGFDGFVEAVLQKLDSRLTRYIFCTPELRQKTDDKNLYYYSPSRVDTLVGLIITSVIFILLILPVVSMYELTTLGTRNSTFHAIGVLIVFTLLFGAAMSVLTRARRHELFAASAAYCAVLVVFISNFGNGNVNGVGIS